jgi:GNAT superfamily N-acetyltransferase
MTAVAVGRADGLIVSDDPARLDLDRIAGWLATSYWASQRPRGTIERSIAGSRCFGVYDDADQIGFARAVTDGATFCWIADVIVDEAYRGRGVGTWLVRVITEELAKDGVQRFVLATRDAHGVYERIGFSGLRIPEIWMEIDGRPERPNAADIHIATPAANSTQAP